MNETPNGPFSNYGEKLVDMPNGAFPNYVEHQVETRPQNINGSFRSTCAGIGWSYDSATDVLIPPLAAGINL